MRVVLGLGSNLGSRWALVASAMDVIEARFGEAKRSSFVRTPAMTWEDAPPGPDYLNAAMSFECTWALADLLTFTQSLEQRFGRQRGERWGNRTLDIDILWAPMSCDSPRVPHPGLLERDFALGPAMEVHRALRDEHKERLLEMGGMPTLVMPPTIERTPERVHVRRALDKSDALAIAWGATTPDATRLYSTIGQSAMRHSPLRDEARVDWIEAPPTSPLCAASACINTADAHLIRPAAGKWELESLTDSSCVLNKL